MSNWCISLAEKRKVTQWAKCQLPRPWKLLSSKGRELSQGWAVPKSNRLEHMVSFLIVSCSCRENRFHLAKVKLKNSQWHIYIDYEQKTAIHQECFFSLSVSCLREIKKSKAMTKDTSISIIYFTDSKKYIWTRLHRLFHILSAKVYGWLFH